MTAALLVFVGLAVGFPAGWVARHVVARAQPVGADLAAMQRSGELESVVASAARHIAAAVEEEVVRERATRMLGGEQ